MRAALFSICLLLLCGGNTVYANTHSDNSSHPSNHAPSKRQHAKLTHSIQDNTILDDADLDLDEDYLRGHDNDDGSTNAFLAERCSMPEKWYLNFTPVINSDYAYRHFKSFPPFFDDASPIYLKQRVLKI